MNCYFETSFVIIYHNTVLESTNCSFQLMNQEVFYCPWLKSCIKIEILWTILSLTNTTESETGTGTESSSAFAVWHRFAMNTRDWDPELTFWHAQEVCVLTSMFGLYRSLEAVTTCFKNYSVWFCLSNLYGNRNPVGTGKIHQYWHENRAMWYHSENKS